MAKKSLSEFETAFAKARKEQGAGGTFEFKGKTYSTDRADDKVGSGTKPSRKPKTDAPKVEPAASKPEASKSKAVKNSMFFNADTYKKAGGSEEVATEEPKKKSGAEAARERMSMDRTPKKDSSAPSMKSLFFNDDLYNKIKSQDGADTVEKAKGGALRGWGKARRKQQ